MTTKEEYQENKTYFSDHNISYCKLILDKFGDIK
jgi:hypothetical protein